MAVSTDLELHEYLSPNDTGSGQEVSWNYPGALHWDWLGDMLAIQHSVLAAGGELR